MTITQITDFVLFGNSTDTKPLAGTPSQSLFFEIDTGRTYKFTAGVWSLFSGDIKQETLTNKTITTPTIAAIKVNSGANTLTLPTITDTVVGRSTTDTLLNKTLISPIISTISNAGVITLPSGTRTLVARDTLDTLLNKTINVNSNTLSATSQANGDLLVNNATQFIRLARGTNGQVLQSTSSGIAWATIATGGAQYTAKYTIYITGGGSPVYNCRNNITSSVESTNTSAAVVLQYAIDNSTYSGTVYVTGGVYPLSTSVNAKAGIKIVGEGRETTILKPTGNFPAMIIGATTGVWYVDISDLLFFHNQSGYTSSLVRFTGNAKWNQIRNCDFYDSGLFVGNAMSFENVAAANAGTGITLNRVFDCNVSGFAAAIYMSTANGGSPINFVNDNNFYNVNAEWSIRFLKCNGVASSNIDNNRFINCTFQSGSGAAAPAVAFDYADSATHNYTVHVGCIAWDLPAGVKYANINTSNMGSYLSLIGCVPVSNDPTTYIGGPGAGGSTVIKTEGSNLDLAASRTFTGYNQFLLTGAGGFEDITKFGINGSADYLSISNNTNTTAGFASLIRANITSASATRFVPGLYFQTILAAALDTADAEPAITFAATRPSNVVLSNRPICSFRNGLSTDVLQVFPTYMDMKGNQIQNAVMGGVKWAITTKTASYTATDTDVVILCDTTSSAITITLPAASGRAGKFYAIHRKAGTTNAITIDPNASELIDGATTITVPTAANSSKWIFSDGTAWYSK